MSQKFRAYDKVSKYGLAIVTGGSSGIGYSIIEQIGRLGLATRVFNLSRAIPASFYNVENLHHLECDLADRLRRREAFTLLEHQLDQLPPDSPILLVNNAGFGLFGPIDTHTPAQHLEVLEVNALALVELTTLLLPRLRERGGAILNVASTAAFQPTPFMATYAAAKSFVLNWTIALNEELRPYPQIRAIAVCPGSTRTDFFRRAGIGAQSAPPGYSQTSEQVAAAALRALSRRSPFIVTGWPNKFMTAAAARLPRALVARIAGLVVAKFRSQQQ